MARNQGISPLILSLVVLFIAALWLRYEDPIVRRPAYKPPSLWSRNNPPPPHAQVQPNYKNKAYSQPPPKDVIAHYPEWFRDVSSSDKCGYDRDLEGGYYFSLNLRNDRGFLEPLLSTKELLILAWVSHRYQINPHFLLGIMDAESGGDCSAVSVAGAQGCFQITDSFGAEQLIRAYPERMMDWHWAKRSLKRPSHRPWPPENRISDYYPSDIFVDPQLGFDEFSSDGEFPASLKSRIRRQLRFLVDPVATELRSETFGSINVSSVASFNFGAVGSALYFHWQNSFLFSQRLLHDDFSVAFTVPGAKALWMAAAYNQGFNRSLRQFVQSGTAFPSSLRADVANYAHKVTAQCLLLEQGSPLPDRPISWVMFLDFMQSLRWTYSAVPVAWDSLFPMLQSRHFGAGPIPLKEVPRVFDDMVHLEPALRAATASFDYEGGYEGQGAELGID